MFPAREISISGQDTSDCLSKAERRELQQLKKKSRKTEKELKRIGKALAEAAKEKTYSGGQAKSEIGVRSLRYG